VRPLWAKGWGGLALTDYDWDNFSCVSGPNQRVQHYVLWIRRT
jgi:hypothetical protein